MVMSRILSYNYRMQVFKFQENRDLSLLISESLSVRTEKKKTFINNMLSNFTKGRDLIENDLRNSKMNNYHEL